MLKPCERRPVSRSCWGSFCFLPSAPAAAFPFSPASTVSSAGPRRDCIPCYCSKGFEFSSITQVARRSSPRHKSVAIARLKQAASSIRFARSGDLLFCDSPIREKDKLPDIPAVLLDAHRITSLPLLRNLFSNADSFGEIIGRVKGIFGALTRNVELRHDRVLQFGLRQTPPLRGQCTPRDASGQLAGLHRRTAEGWQWLARPGIVDSPHEFDLQ